jgi:hypothetical protein
VVIAEVCSAFCLTRHVTLWPYAPQILFTLRTSTAYLSSGPIPDVAGEGPQQPRMSHQPGSAKSMSSMGQLEPGSMAAAQKPQSRKDQVMLKVSNTCVLHREAAGSGLCKSLFCCAKAWKSLC